MNDDEYDELLIKVNILAKMFADNIDEEYLEFERVENKFSKRADLHAFILLDKLIPDKEDDIVSQAEHDEFCLGVDLEELANSGITEEQVIDLLRCGVRIYDCGLMMFA